MSLLVWMPLNGNIENKGLLNLNPTINNIGTWDNTSSILDKSYKTNNGGIINLNNNISLNSTFSFSVWVKVNSFSNWGRVFSLINNYNEDNIGLCADNTSSKLGFHIYKDINGTKTKLLDIYSFSVSANEWNNIIIVVNGTNVKLYQNGTLVTETTMSYTYEKTTTINLIGGSHNGNTITAFLNCNVNDFRIYDHALSIKEVKELSKGLILHYPMNNNGLGFVNPNLIANSLPNNITGWSWAGTGWRNITLVDNDFSPSGKVIRCTFNGETAVQGGIHKPLYNKYELENNQYYTISAYIRASKQCDILFRNEMMKNGNIIQVNTEWKKYIFTSQINSLANHSSDIFYVKTSSNITNGDWIEVCMLKLEKGQVATPWVPHITDTNFNELNLDSKNVGINPNLMTGNFSCTSSNTTYSYSGNTKTIFTSNLDLLKKYAGRNLYFSYEVKSDGDSQSTSSDYRATRFGIHGCFVYTKTGASTKTTIYPFVTHLGIGKIRGRYCCRVWTIPTDIDTISYFALSIQTNPNNGLAKPADTNNETWLIKNLKLEFDSPSDYIDYNSDLNNTKFFNNDTSGYNNDTKTNLNNIILSTPIISNDSKIYNSSYYFNGCCFFESMKTMGGAFNKDYSICVWIKPLNSTRSVIFSNSDSNDGVVAFEINTSLYLRSYFTSNCDYISTSKVTLNKWNHVVVTKRNKTFTFYINGIKCGENTYSETLPTINSTTSCFRIGDDTRGNTDSTVSFKGYMNDFRFYATALSDNDIKELYQTPISIDKDGNCFAKEFVEEDI